MFIKNISESVSLLMILICLLEIKLYSNDVFSFSIHWTNSYFFCLQFKDSTKEYKLSKLKLNIEVLVCTDYSIYKMHHKILSLNKWNVFNENNKTSQNSVISHIKAYYSQIIDDVRIFFLWIILILLQLSFRF